VVFSEAPRSVLELALEVPAGCTASQALTSAAAAWGVPPDALQSLQLGVWGKPVSAPYLLHDGDRLEVYRALTVDPKVARRERFVRQGSKGAGLFAKRRSGGKAGY
jgi:uncharacterized protein